MNIRKLIFVIGAALLTTACYEQVQPETAPRVVYVYVPVREHDMFYRDYDYRYRSRIEVRVPVRIQVPPRMEHRRPEPPRRAEPRPERRDLPRNDHRQPEPPRKRP
jgi:hypothetical protein